MNNKRIAQIISLRDSPGSPGALRGIDTESLTFNALEHVEDYELAHQNNQESSATIPVCRGPLHVTGCRGGARRGSSSRNSKMANVAPTVIGKNQTYALCAKAKCFVFSSLAYCECDILSGNSVSATFSYSVLPPDAAKQNICDLNAQGAGNGFMASTYSLPPEALKGGNMAVYTCYTCPSSSAGACAQCDGGICFNSTSGNAFPGFTKPLAGTQIICSCPISEASASKNPFG